MHIVILAILFAFTNSALADLECERHLFKAKGAHGSKFIFGQSTHVNLGLLKNFELIEDEVRERFYAEVNSVQQLTRKESHAIALTYYSNPTEANRQRVFRALQILIPIASRHLLSRVHRAETLEDYFQSGYLNVWSRIPNILKVPPKKMRSLFYWDGITNGFRKVAFAAMRAQFKKMYSLTPVALPKTTNFTFEEEILLFGDSAEARAEISNNYGMDPLEAEQEWRLQNFSLEHNEEAAQAISRDGTPEQVAETLENQDLRKVMTAALVRLSPRKERVIREIFFRDRTLEQTADTLGGTRERIRQIREVVLRDLRHPAYSRILRRFLPDAEFYRQLPPREYWDAKYRVELRRREEEQAAERAESEHSVQRQALAAAELEFRKNAIADIERIHTETEELALESSALWAEFAEIESSERLLRIWDGFRAILESEIKSFMSSVAGFTENGEPAAVEAALLQNRRRQLEHLAGFTATLQERMVTIREMYNSAHALRDAIHARSEDQYGVIGTLRKALQNIRDAQDRGDTSADVEETRRVSAELLRKKELELESSNAPDRTSAFARLNRLEEMLKMGF